jgi:hypothetical protein
LRKVVAGEDWVGSVSTPVIQRYEDQLTAVEAGMLTTGVVTYPLKSRGVAATRQMQVAVPVPDRSRQEQVQ